MQRLQQLLESLDSAANDAIKVQHLKSYFSSTPSEDAAWVLYFLEHKRVKTKTGQRLLKEILTSQTGFPEWIFRECNDRVNDVSETLALLMPWSNGTCELSLSTLAVQFLQPLSGFSQLAKRETIRCAWEMLSTSQRVLFNKMILGGFHLGVSKTLIHEALSQISGIDEPVISRRLIEDWEPSATWFQGLIKPDPEIDLAMTPCPFQTITESSPLADQSKPTTHWEAAWAYDGLRVQAIRRRDVSTIWSTDHIPLNHYFPELLRSVNLLPSGTVLEGFIVGWIDDRPNSIENVNRRLKANSLNQKLIQTTPVHFMALDIIERHGVDLSDRPFAERRIELEQVMQEWSHQWTLHGNNPTNKEVNPDVFQQEMFDMESVLKPEPERPDLAPPMSLSELKGYDDWGSVEADLKKCRDKNATGLLLSPFDSQEKLSHNDNGWILAKPAPFKVKLALISAEREPGNQTIFSQYTFGAWHQGTLVSVAILGPIHSELVSESLSEFVIENTEQKRGNNWQVKAGMICEISFEAIQKSPRSKSGIRLQNPRMNECGSSKDLKQVTSVEKIISLVKE